MQTLTIVSRVLRICQCRFTAHSGVALKAVHCGSCRFISITRHHFKKIAPHFYYINIPISAVLNVPSSKVPVERKL